MVIKISFNCPQVSQTSSVKRKSDFTTVSNVLQWCQISAQLSNTDKLVGSQKHNSSSKLTQGPNMKFLCKIYIPIT